MIVSFSVLVGVLNSNVTSDGSRLCQPQFKVESSLIYLDVFDVSRDLDEGIASSFFFFLVLLSYNYLLCISLAISPLSKLNRTLNFFFYFRSFIRCQGHTTRVRTL